MGILKQLNIVWENKIIFIYNLDYTSNFLLIFSPNLLFIF